MTLIPIHEVDRLQSAPTASSSRKRLPSWFKVSTRQGPDYKDVRRIVDEHGLHTICEEARCPNVWECWNNRTATFLLLGDICTRRCHYCAVTTGRPGPIDWDEPRHIAQAVETLRLRHAVLTSVNRDDLEDGGARVFAETIRGIKQRSPTCTVEILVPDFKGDRHAIDTVLHARPDIFNHNIETVPRLFPTIRPQGKYDRSIGVLQHVKELGAYTKSGLIVGMGETADEIREVMRDLRRAGCDILTIGQYLQPTKQHRPITRFYDPEEFSALKKEGRAMGFTHVESGPLVRSSYHADRQVTHA